MKPRGSAMAVMVAIFLVLGRAGSWAEPSQPMTLNRAIETALENSRLIRSAAASSRAAVAARKSARADFFPEISAAYQYANLSDTPYMYFEKAVVVPPGLTVGAQRIEAPTGTRDNYAWHLRLVQPLFTGFALSTRARMADTGVAARKVEKAQAVMDVIKQVRLGYIQILCNEKIRRAARDAVESLSAHAVDAEKFYGQGMIPYNDLLQSRVALAAARQRHTEIQGRCRSGVAALNTLLGLDLNRDTRVAELPEPAPRRAVLATLLETARRRRPELQVLNLALARIDQGITLAKSAYYPQLAMVGQYQQAGDDPGATRNDFRNSHNSSISLQAEWRLNTGGKTRAETARLRHARKALEEKRLGIAESIDLEVKDAVIRMEVAEKNIKTAEKALAQAGENLRITNLRYQQQMTTSTEVLDANTAVTRAKTDYYGARYAHQGALAELDRAVGLQPEGMQAND